MRLFALKSGKRQLQHILRRIEGFFEKSSKNFFWHGFFVWRNREPALRDMENAFGSTFVVKRIV